MNTVVSLHPPIIQWNGIQFDHTVSGFYVPLAAIQRRVEAAIGIQNLHDNIVDLMPKGKSMVAFSESANMPGEIDYLCASLGYEPIDMPAGSSKIEEVHEVKSLLDSMNKVFLTLLRGSGGDKYAIYQKARKVGQILRKSYNQELNRYLFGKNWFLADSELWNTNQNVSDSLHGEGGRVVSIIASRLGIPVELTKKQEENAKSIKPVYQKMKKLKKAA